MGTPTCTVEASALGDPAGFDIVINAMSLGVNSDDPLPVDVFVRFQSGSIGTITEDRVVVQPNALYGIRLPGPQGTYPTRRFSSVRVELMSGAAGYGDTVVQGEHTSGSGLWARTARRTFSSRGRSEKRAGHWPRSSAPCAVLILVIQRSPLPTVRIAYTDGETDGPESSSVHCVGWRCTCGSLRTSTICFDVPVLYR